MTKYATVRRRESIPQELEDPDDCTVGEAPAQDDDVLVMSSQSALSFSFNNSFQSNIGTLPKEIRNIIGGGIAGMVAKSVVAPADRIKILFQVSSVEFRLRNLPLVVGTIRREEGWTALWKGNTATMIRVIPYSGIQFMVFEKCKTYFLQQHSKGIYPIDQGSSGKHGLTPLESLLSGMLAGSVSVVCTYPLDLARAQLAVLKRKQNAAHSIRFLDIFRQNYSRGGITGLFRGLSITLAGMLPYAGIAFALNEQTKREIQHVTGRDLSTMERIQCGALAGLVAQTVTYPLEVTRRRMQTIGLVGTDTALAEIGNRTIPTVAPPTIRETIRSLYAEQGVRGFFKGVTMNWMKGPVAFGISFTTFDFVKKFLETEEERQSQRNG
ncbi:solute carrier family 25, member 42 [Fistulifera solaris]|uniref:Solute carrier family 25, member 42 n=1 Tax=Fistulifera solaris TaxID=1519565 RepID=A0A1Z5K746_FISSO|nr:solute carrier family 25, member 42 [Fistulifera solaris]|eukprot:GAX22067.1 solute carrier family 25, member 42 [Fistulifera solaris]